MKFGVGQPHVRVEDASLLTGHGHYLADVIPEDALRAVVVRSPHAHARFSIQNLEAIRSLPGVRLLLTGADITDYGSVPCQGVIKPSDEEKMWATLRRIPLRELRRTGLLDKLLALAGESEMPLADSGASNDLIDSLSADALIAMALESNKSDDGE